ncbi:MAG TPA: hypothetical protein GXX24_05805 [Paracoccus solventivorans]|uniref:Uncharacterized protein n=1 Tax=Paracoccus solventivorans TaxID=53463 RepID=A0A832PL92_9RHOB|nr:hypothetical protein [Paracoccus solventivorans]HHW33638.1 hypothetical protein [Paracoccus solventivorans]
MYLIRKNPARLSWLSGVRAVALVAASMVAMAGDVKLDLSMGIARHSDLPEVVSAAEVPVVAAHATDGCG